VRTRGLCHLTRARLPAVSDAKLFAN
jgi:hypothetical protein